MINLVKELKMNIYKIEYYWHEGEHEETFLAKDVSKDEFEKDIIKAREFAESLIGKGMEYDYLGKGYSVECLPQYYRQIIWFLTNKLGYIDCLIDSEISYQIEDYENRIIIQKSEKKIETKEL